MLPDSVVVSENTSGGEDAGPFITLHRKHETSYENNVYKQCVNDYKWHMWVPDYECTFIASPDTMDGVHPRYVQKRSEPLVYGERVYQKASDMFFILQCGLNKHRRVQKGDVLTCFEDDNKQVQFLVLFQTKSGNVLLQNEAIFAAEQAWFRKRQASYNDAVNSFMFTNTDDPNIKSILSGICRKYLATVMTQCLSNKYNSDNIATGPHFKDSDPFITELEDAFSAKALDKSVGDYVRDVAEFVTFIEPSNQVGSLAKTFRSRLRANMYEAKAIPALAIDVKLPELFAVHSDAKMEELRSDVLKVVNWKLVLLFVRAITLRWVVLLLISTEISGTT